jgi:hypothetical protein
MNELTHRQRGRRAIAEPWHDNGTAKAIYESIHARGTP